MPLQSFTSCKCLSNGWRRYLKEKRCWWYRLGLARLPESFVGLSGRWVSSISAQCVAVAESKHKGFGHFGGRKSHEGLLPRQCHGAAKVRPPKISLVAPSWHLGFAFGPLQGSMGQFSQSLSLSDSQAGAEGGTRLGVFLRGLHDIPPRAEVG